MTAPEVRSNQLRCHHCSHWVGESSSPVEFAGMFRSLRDRVFVEEPRTTFQCRHCKWVNVFRPTANPAQRWQPIEMK
jgi:phage FluMu protein Com